MQNGDASYLLRTTMDSFQIQGDLQTLDRIQENLAALKLKQTEKIDQSRDALRNLSRQFDLTKSSYETSTTSEEIKARQKELLELDKQKFTLAKTLTELDASHSNLQSTIAKLQEELAALETEDIFDATSSHLNDSMAVQLKLYRDLGVSFEDENSEVKKVIINSKDKDTTHLLNIEEKYSDYFITNYIWDRL